MSVIALPVPDASAAAPTFWVAGKRQADILGRPDLHLGGRDGGGRGCGQVGGENRAGGHDRRRVADHRTPRPCLTPDKRTHQEPILVNMLELVRPSGEVIGGLAVSAPENT